MKLFYIRRLVIFNQHRFFPHNYLSYILTTFSFIQPLSVQILFTLKFI